MGERMSANAQTQACLHFAVHCMAKELNANEPKKGPFLTWEPNAADAFRELQHHTRKLFDALELAKGASLPDVQNREEVTEYCADIANIAMRIHHRFGLKLWCSACGKWSDHQSGTCPTITH